MKILWITNIPSPYRVDFFNELGKKSNLTVLFERENSKERNKKWIKNEFENFEGFFLKGLKLNVDKALSFQIINFLNKKEFDHIIISNPLTPTGMLAINYMKIKKIKYSIVSDGGFAKNGRGITEKIKSFIISRATLYFSTADVHDKYYLMYGAKKERIFRYPFTSLKEKEILKFIPTEIEKEKLKTALGIKEKKVILCVGQFIDRKGIDVLLKTTSLISENIGVYIVGGNPTQEFMNLRESLGSNNIHFLDFKTKEELSEYYRAANIFVLPTREDIWGLVINEAMANGLPVITTEKCIAGLELITEGVNGYIIPINNSELLAKKINMCFSDKINLREMGKESLNKIRNYTIENMAEITIDILINNIEVIRKK